MDLWFLDASIGVVLKTTCECKHHKVAEDFSNKCFDYATDILPDGTYLIFQESFVNQYGRWILAKNDNNKFYLLRPYELQITENCK